MSSLTRTRLTWLQAVLLSHIAEPGAFISEGSIDRVASIIEAAAIEFRRIKSEGTGDAAAVSQWLIQQLGRYGFKSPTLDAATLHDSLANLSEQVAEHYRRLEVEDAIADLSERDAYNKQSHCDGEPTDQTRSR